MNGLLGTMPVSREGVLLLISFGCMMPMLRYEGRRADPRPTSDIGGRHGEVRGTKAVGCGRSSDPGGELAGSRIDGPGRGGLLVLERARGSGRPSGVDPGR